MVWPYGRARVSGTRLWKSKEIESMSGRSYLTQESCSIFSSFRPHTGRASLCSTRDIFGLRGYQNKFRSSYDKHVLGFVGHTYVSNDQLGTTPERHS